MKNEEKAVGPGKSFPEKPYGSSGSARHQTISGSHPEDSSGGHSKKSQTVIGHVGPRTASDPCESLGGMKKKIQREGGSAVSTSAVDEALGGTNKVMVERPHFSERVDIGEQSSRPGFHSGIPTAKNRSQQSHTVRTVTAEGLGKRK